MFEKELTTEDKLKLEIERLKEQNKRERSDIAYILWTIFILGGGMVSMRTTRFIASLTTSVSLWRPWWVLRLWPSLRCRKGTLRPRVLSLESFSTSQFLRSSTPFFKERHTLDQEIIGGGQK